MKCVIFALLAVVVICPIAHAKYSGGAGEPNNPYQIATAEDLNDIGNHPEDFNKCFIMTADIDLSFYSFSTAVIARDTTNDLYNFTFDGTAFSGVFDGAWHKIYNLTIYPNEGNKYLGLFGDVNGGQIKNLTLEDFNITGVNYTGYDGGLAGVNNGNISNCFSTGTIYAGANSSLIGGLVGLNYGDINSCYSKGTITGYLSFSEGRGGLVGRNNAGGTITKCYSSTNVTCAVYAFPGGGGLVGYNYGNITNCFATGSVIRGCGLVQSNYGGTISNCYSTGDVNGDASAGLVGYNTGTVTASFWDVNTSGTSSSAGGTGKTTAEMKTKTTFTNAGWDFNDVWTINEGVDYPKLVWSFKYSGGSGEPNDPYQIANVADLLTLAADANDYNKCFIMIADINLDPCLPGGQVFTTAVIAHDINNTNYGTFDGNAFSGIFDGAGHKIHKLNIDTNDNNGVRNDFLGLFGDINNGTVTNLILQDFNIIGRNDSNYLGGLVGYNYYGNISNCSATGAVTKGNHVGGLVGWNTGNIIDCYVTSDIDGGDNSRNLGGLAGYNRFGNISYCYSTGRVAGKYNLGGLVGYNSRFGNISYCYSTNIISGYVSSGLGGLVGCNDDDGSISNCFSTGYVTSNGNMSWNSGGLVGDNRSSISNCFSTGDVAGVYGSYYIGGLVGINGPFSPIINCYSTGTVTGGSVLTYAGGLVGCNYDYSGGLQGSYFLVTSGPNNGYGTPLTDTQMKQQASFVGWDFVWETINGPNDIWAICEGVSYPKLAWQYVIGDSDNDKDVDFTDFALMGSKWRQADSTLYCGGSDLTGDQWVDLDDLDAFVENWLQSSIVED